ncbi:unnamed protein product [Schistocephalus solidus]|uniref:alkaline phosphatase n=1 Tax=Schistocephalus solidus TaxID=70667 RepID=A0A183TSJ7_SCHSO|nr:unnamed protein product [Schistocephalus solidus]
MFCVHSRSDIQRDCRGRSCRCRDLASQLVLENPNINVILGGGQANFYPNHTHLPSAQQKLGARLDGRRLTDIWLRRQRARGHKAKYLGKPSDFPADFSLDADYLLGCSGESTHTSSLECFVPFCPTLQAARNSRSDRPERRTALVARELQRYKVGIAALSEIRFSEQGQLEEVGAGYTFWSGRPKAE